MAVPIEQTGVVVACPGCGTEVLQRTMIPVLTGAADHPPEGVGAVPSYLCVGCARSFITTGSRST